MSSQLWTDKEVLAVKEVKSCTAKLLLKRDFYCYDLHKCSCGNATYIYLKRNGMSFRICSRFYSLWVDKKNASRIRRVIFRQGVTQPPFVLLNFDDTYRISEILKCNESSTFTWCALQFLPHPDSSFWKGTKLCYDKECHLLMRKIGEEHIVILRTIGVERHLGSNSIVIFCGTQRKCMLNTGNKTTKTLRILLPLVLRIYFRKTGWLCRASNESKVMLLWEMWLWSGRESIYLRNMCYKKCNRIEIEVKLLSFELFFWRVT